MGSPAEPCFSEGPYARRLLRWGEHSEILKNFIFEFVFCKWSQQDHGAHTGGLEAPSLPPTQVLLVSSSLFPGPHLGTPAETIAAICPGKQ